MFQIIFSCFVVVPKVLGIETKIFDVFGDAMYLADLFSVGVTVIGVDNPMGTHKLEALADLCHQEDHRLMGGSLGKACLGDFVVEGIQGDV